MYFYKKPIKIKKLGHLDEKTAKRLLSIRAIQPKNTFQSQEVIH